jgi:type IV pilus assembly protein PilB
MRKRLGELLIDAKKIDTIQLKSALAHQRRWGKRLGVCLTDLGFLTEMDLISCLSKQLQLPMIDVTRIPSTNITKSLLDQINPQIARKDRIVPLAIKEIKKKRRLILATSEPTNYQIFDDLQFKTGFPIIVMLAPDGDIEWFIRRYYLNETDFLSENYVSGISLSGGAASKEAIDIDPISSVFYDESFTNVSRLYDRGKPPTGDSSDS